MSSAVGLLLFAPLQIKMVTKGLMAQDYCRANYRLSELLIDWHEQGWLLILEALDYYAYEHRLSEDQELWCRCSSFMAYLQATMLDSSSIVNTRSISNSKDFNRPRDVNPPPIQHHLSP